MALGLFYASVTYTNEEDDLNDLTFANKPI